MRIPLTRYDRDQAFSHLARHAAAGWKMKRSAAQETLSRALGFRDFHDLQQADLPDTLPLVGALFPADTTGFSALTVRREIALNLYRHCGLNFSLAVVRSRRIDLRPLSLWPQTLEARVEAQQAALASANPNTFYVLDEFPGLPVRAVPPVTGAVRRATELGAPGHAFALRPDGQVFLWTRLLGLTGGLPEDVALTDDELRTLVAEAWVPLQTCWDDLPLRRQFQPVRLQVPDRPSPGWAVLVPSAGGVLPELFADEEAAVQGLMRWLNGEGSSPGEHRRKLAGPLEYVRSAGGRGELPLVRVKAGQLSGPVFFHHGRPLLSTLNMLEEPTRALWAALGLEKPDVSLTPPEWQSLQQQMRVTIRDRGAHLNAQGQRHHPQAFSLAGLAARALRLLGRRADLLVPGWGLDTSSLDLKDENEAAQASWLRRPALRNVPGRLGRGLARFVSPDYGAWQWDAGEGEAATVAQLLSLAVFGDLQPVPRRSPVNDSEVPDPWHPLLMTALDLRESGVSTVTVRSASAVWKTRSETPHPGITLHPPGSDLVVVGEEISLEGQPSPFAGVLDSLSSPRS